MSEQFCDVGRGITLCYETFGDRDRPPLLLIMGLGTQMIGWHEDFCAQLAERGFHVVRFDNRDVGRSTHCRGRPPRLHQIVARRFDRGQYTLTDLADDAARLIGRLDLAPAHVVGASMGGMIAQTLAAERPESVRSLTSIMSNTGHRLKGQPALGAYRHILKRAPRDRDGYIEHMTRVFSLIGSPGLPTDLDEVRDVVARHYDRDRSRADTGRQLAAILASGNRTERLTSVTVPTVVIHGSGDRLVRPSGGKATAEAIPDAELEMIEGMGHDLPRAAWPRILDAIAQNAARADGEGGIESVAGDARAVGG